MSRRVRFLFLGIFSASAVTLLAQSPSPSPSPSATAPPPSPTPTAEAIIESMSSADLQQAIQLLKSNYISPDALSETELDRAMLSGVLERLGPGVTIFAQRAPQPNESTNPCYGELIEGHIGYIRLGALTS